jgi:tetratricopeptide (TPR) repeat protein
MDSNFERTHFWLAAAYEQKQMYQDAIDEYTIALGHSGGTLEERASLGHAYACAGHRAQALRILAELSTETTNRYVSPYDMAVVSLGLEENESAIEWLVQACDEHAGWMIYLTVDPRLDCIRQDARFKQLLRTVGFES